MKYRKKPIVIEAVRFDGCDSTTGWLFSEKPRWFQRALDNGSLGLELEVPGFRQPARVRMRTIHGEWAYARAGDWIVPEPQIGRFYPVDPDIFAATYDTAEEHA